jgi:tetratricopeptide (TPR) repeat protein
MSEPTKNFGTMRDLPREFIAISFCISLFCTYTYGDNHPSIEIEAVSDYMEAIDMVEAEHSAFAGELSDLYLGLGRALVVQQDFEKAKRAFEQGMQVERINNGLYSITQRPHLLSLADTESFLGNWKQSRNALNNLYLINQQAYGDSDPKLLPVLNEILSWLLKTYPQRSVTGGYENLILAERIGETINEITGNDINGDPEEKFSTYNKLVSLHYMIADHIRQHGDTNDSGITFSTNELNVNNRILTSSHLHFQRGKRALEKGVETLVSQNIENIEDQALAIARLGDWYLIFGQKQAAKKCYKLASDILQTRAGSGDQKPVLFDTPSIIKFDLEQLSSPPSATEEAIEIAMNITPVGRIEDIEVINAEQEISEKQLSSLRRNLRTVRFRPRLEDGEPVISSHSAFFSLSILER